MPAAHRRVIVGQVRIHRACLLGLAERLGAKL